MPSCLGGVGLTEMSSAHIDVSSSARVDPSVRIVGVGTLFVLEYAVIEPNVLIDLGQTGDGVIRIGPRSRIKYGSVLRTYGGQLSVGRRSSLGEYGVWAAHGGIVVGDSVIVGSHCTVSASEHIFYESVPIRFQGERADGICIENGVWVGSGVRILDGCCVGDGAVVGAGAVVTKSVDPSTLVAGVPARLIGHRRMEH